MEYLKDTEHFGETFKKGEDENLGVDVEKFFGKLLPWIEGRVFNRTSKRVNWLLRHTDGFINVKDYGAVGDRATDDTVAIQAAINAVPNQPFPTTIYFPPGRYLISATLTIGGGQRIILEGSSVITGSNSTEIYFPTGQNTDFIDASTNLTNVFSVVGLQFTGAGMGTGTGNCLVIGKDGTNSAFDSQIHNCWFVHIPNKCISAVNMRDYTINSCIFEACDYGIYFENPVGADSRCNSGNRIFGNRFFVTKKAHIYLERGRSNMFFGNQFDRLANFSGGTNDDTVAAIVIDNSGYINHTTLIANNVFGGTGGGNMNDIVLKGTADYAAYTGVFGVTIVGNTSFQAVRHFLYINEADLTAIIDNHIIDACVKTTWVDADVPAIEIEGSSHGTYIDGNVQRIVATDADKQVTYGLHLGSSTTGTILGTNHFNGKTGNINIVSGATLVNPTVTPALVYGEISRVSNAVETTITSQNVYVQVTIFDTNGENNNSTPDHTEDHITITKAGRYLITCSVTLNSVGGAGSTAEMEVQKNNGNVRVGALHVDRTLSGGGAEASAETMTGIANLSVNDTIEVWIKNETNTQNYVVEDITLSLTRIGR